MAEVLYRASEHNGWDCHLCEHYGETGATPAVWVSRLPDGKVCLAYCTQHVPEDAILSLYLSKAEIIQHLIS